MGIKDDGNGGVFLTDKDGNKKHISSKDVRKYQEASQFLSNYSDGERIMNDKNYREEILRKLDKSTNRKRD